MTPIERYRSAVLAAATCARIMAGHDIPELLAAISRSNTLGPLLDPTAWIQNSGKMEEDRQMLAAALELHKIGVEMERRNPSKTN